MPKDTEPEPLPAATFSPDQFAQLLSALSQQQSGAGITPEVLGEILERTQKATAKSLRPENEQHPERSAMSYPEGDRTRPRPQIVGELWWNGYPQHRFQEELHWSEAELLPQLRPGNYTCSNKDGRTTRPVEVKATYDAENRLERMDVLFPVNREDSNQRPPLYVWLYQMVHRGTHQTASESFMVGLTQYLKIMFDDEQAKSKKTA